jgi:hypothetical protein
MTDWLAFYRVDALFASVEIHRRRWRHCIKGK